MTLLTAIHTFCVQCVGSAKEVRNCKGDKMIGQGDKNNVCWFYPYRLGKGRPQLTLVRKLCLECMGMDRNKKIASEEIKNTVEECHVLDCPIFEYRLGENSKRRRGDSLLFGLKDPS